MVVHVSTVQTPSLVNALPPLTALNARTKSLTHVLQIHAKMEETASHGEEVELTSVVAQLASMEITVKTMLMTVVASLA